MVYDEGFNLEFGQFSFFAFSKYTVEVSYENLKVYKSKCYSTLTGWYSNGDKTKRGCYQAMKVGVDPLKDTYINTKKEKLLNRNVIQTIRRRSLPIYASFLSLNEKYIFPVNSLSSEFTDHQKYIEILNKISNKSWEAELYPELKSKSIKDLNRFAGFPRFKERSKESQILRIAEDLSEFPVNFDWKSLLRPAATQGECGSCYAISTARMMEARLKLIYNHDVNLSVQHALDCSYYNQGCNGGYPFLVMKFANEFEMIPEYCQPYLGVTSDCNKSCNILNLKYIYKIINYKYVGGSYGKCNERAMMEELFKNGPFVVSFEPDYNFLFYKTGIYHSIDLGTWIDHGLPKPEWEKVDHSVLLVGWGQDMFTGDKFWILQNTLGPSWGEGGFFRIKRGTDEFAIESICEAGTPIIVDNLTKLTLVPDVSKKNIVKTTGNVMKFRKNPVSIIP